jgi:tRNA1Val (adenine37-N6)-methyltransferase
MTWNVLRCIKFSGNSLGMPFGERKFKGWTKPGALLERTDIELAQAMSPDETLDALSGDFRIFQLREGHRFSTDDLLAAWYGTSIAPSVSRVLDLGSGIGSVGMTAAWRIPGARFVTVETQEQSVRLARKSAIYNRIEERYEIRHGDFRDTGILKSDEKFDLVLGSPPYFAEDGGLHGDHPQKVACRFEMKGTVVDYCKTAAMHLAPGGVFAFVFPIQPEKQLEKIGTGAQDAGLSIIRFRPVCFREGEAPLIGLFAMVLSTDLPEKYRTGSQPLWTEPVLTIRTRSGEIHPEYSSVKLSIGFPP